LFRNHRTDLHESDFLPLQPESILPSRRQVFQLSTSAPDRCCLNGKKVALYSPFVAAAVNMYFGDFPGVQDPASVVPTRYTNHCPSASSWPTVAPPLSTSTTARNQPESVPLLSLPSYRVLRLCRGAPGLSYLFVYLRPIPRSGRFGNTSRAESGPGPRR
jgi:hypothetical protein